VAAIREVESETRAISGCPPWFALPICATGIAGLLRDSWPTALYLPAGLHALFGAMLWLMVLAQFRQAHRCALGPSGAYALRRRLSRGVFLQLYILFGVSQILRIAVILWNRGQSSAAHMAILQPPENLRDYLAYGVFALLTIQALAVLLQRRALKPVEAHWSVLANLQHDE